MKNVTTRESVPCAYVTKGKQRIKQFDKTVYLNNGDEFEIELFNPTANKVLAEIELNSKSIGAGIVLRPGERVFLERYIETARKFLFETYKVNGNNDEVKQAIANNGNVQVNFYSECTSIWPSGVYTYPYKWEYHSYCSDGSHSGAYGGSAHTTCEPKKQILNDSVNSYYNCYGYASNISANAGETIFTSSIGNVNYNQEIKFKTPIICATEKDESIVDEFKQKEIETGRIEKGSSSNQTFQFDDTRFNTYWTWRSDWKILPKSQKPVTREELNVLYCGNCGARKGKGSFCQYCGANHWVAK